jgi:hypothetical protein
VIAGRTGAIDAKTSVIGGRIAAIVGTKAGCGTDSRIAWTGGKIAAIDARICAIGGKIAAIGGVESFDSFGAFGAFALASGWPNAPTPPDQRVHYVVVEVDTHVNA